MEDSLLAREFDRPPSEEEFSSEIEPKNVPVVFRGIAKDWKAFSSWNPSNGGLDYLLERAGSCVVEAMLTRSAHVFYGDIRSHERVPIPFSTFISLCKKEPQNEDGGHGGDSRALRSGAVVSDGEDCRSLLSNSPRRIYLAQVPIMNSEKEERVQLESLREDIKIPSFISTKDLASVNLWMNNAHSRSSSHYDPHHNLLCIVSGCKRVVLWPPSASSRLKPMPIYGEASNHSSMALELEHHPIEESAFEYSQKVTLRQGDALFLPEGWFHQVDSDELTIAVNFWWRSNIMCCMLEHMDAYYLRILLRRLIDKEMNQMLQSHLVTSSGVMHQEELPCCIAGNQEINVNPELGNEDSEGDKLQLSDDLHDLGSQALKALHELVAIVHDFFNNGDQPQQRNLPHKARISSGMESQNVVVGGLSSLDDDPIPKILWNIGPFAFRSALLAMVHKFPRTLEALILHMLSPIGAEVLTRKFDELHQKMSEEERCKFYQDFYSVFDDQYLAMDAILNGKESFACQAFKNVLNLYVGVMTDGPNLLIK